MGLTVLDRRAAFRKALDAERVSGRTVGLVPTMGALHAGHLSLMARAVSECDVVAVTLFVNPLQFGPAEDLAAYPRDVAGDLAKTEEAGAAYLFCPGQTEMLPVAPVTTVHVAGLADVLEGDLPARTLRRRGDHRGQAVRPGRTVPGVLRREGLPAAGGHTPPRRRPVPAGRGRRVPDRA